MFRRYFWTALLAFQVIALAGCAPAQLNTANVQNTAIALNQTALPIDTPIATYVSPTPSPIPTQPPPPIFTPDAIQVERWKEYQTELAKVLFSYDPNHLEGGYDPEAYKDAICEWDILGQSGLEAYIWAECISGLALKSNPAVVDLKPDGSIRKVNVPSVEINHDLNQFYDLHLFPIEVQEKLCLYYFYGFVPQCHDITSAYIPSFNLQREEVLLSHLKYRKSHAEEPPLVVLSAIPLVAPTP